MKKLRLYLDSSIFGWSSNRRNPGRFAEVNLLLNQIAEGKFIGAYSWVTQQEIESAPNHIAKKLWHQVEISKLIAVKLNLKTQATQLAETYCNRKIVPSDFKADALHIAIATLWKADALVSYNFQHIVNLEIMVAVNRVNKELDLNEIFLCQPQEVIISGN
ncbi:MAG: hypothetical protein JXM79_00855 [Sedimentisphaerales bacterium]|nr:hypothetical protein [Sedimentisphaerales bacterium]